MDAPFNTTLQSNTVDWSLQDGEFSRIEECVTLRSPTEPVLHRLRDDTARLRVRTATGCHKSSDLGYVTMPASGVFSSANPSG